MSTDYRLLKIYDRREFDKITKGLSVAKCMGYSTAADAEIDRHRHSLPFSQFLSCHTCNTCFENQLDQRAHYKLEWHVHNLKRRLRGYKSIPKEYFDARYAKDELSSFSGSGTDNGYETTSSDNIHALKAQRGPRLISSMSDSESDEFEDLEESDSKLTDEAKEKLKKENLSAAATRHTKVFFENWRGKIFSIYRCLLHPNNDIPEADGDMIVQALNCGNKDFWTVIMVGGNYFAAAVFQYGKVVRHKTFGLYTVRAKQGSSQAKHDSKVGGHCKSAGAMLRRANKIKMRQQVQRVIERWSKHIEMSSLIFYRATGPYNRSLLFGGKNPPLDKTDERLRTMPFPTRRANFAEVQRVYDVLTSIEVYGQASDYEDSFPMAPRPEPIRQKKNKVKPLDKIPEQEQTSEGSAETKKPSPSRHGRRMKNPIDRAKARKSPVRPLPEITARYAMSSEDSDCSDEPTVIYNQIFEIKLSEALRPYEDSVPKHIRKRNLRRRKRKMRKERAEVISTINQLLQDSKVKLWEACKGGDCEIFSDTWDEILREIDRWEDLAEKNEGDEISQIRPHVENFIRIINEGDENGNTMLHVAAISGYFGIIWLLLEIGGDPSRRNKNNQTPYAATTDKQTRDVFRRFMAKYPKKYNYPKSHIPSPLTDKIAQEEMNRRRQKKKAKREREEARRKEFEIKKNEEESKQRFLHLSDREKRALAAEWRILEQNGTVVTRCFQCGANMAGLVPFEYYNNRFCSMPCLKEHRLHNKYNV